MAAMFSKVNGYGTMYLLHIILKTVALIWLNKSPAKEMAELILSIRIGGGSLLLATCQGNYDI